MSSASSASGTQGFTSRAPESNMRWVVCGLLFLATTINYMDRSVLSLIEPLLHLPFMGWVVGVDAKYQAAYHLNYGHIVECFQIAYAVGLLVAAVQRRARKRHSSSQAKAASDSATISLPTSCTPVPRNSVEP